MNKKVIICVTVGLCTVVVIGAVVLFVYVLHGKSAGEPVVETTEVYVPETTVEESIPYAVPSEKPSEANVTRRQDNDRYSDTTVCATFSEDIRNYCVDAFGEYLHALQDSCKFLFDAGYEYFVAYETDSDTQVVEENYVEFTAYLPGARARFNIRLDDGEYTTKAWVLADDELVSPSLYAPDGLDSLLETEATSRPSDLLPKNINTWSESENPVLYPGWHCLDTGLHDYTFYTFDSDFITEMVNRDTVECIRNVFGTDAALYDTISVLLSDGYSEEDLKHITPTQESDTSVVLRYDKFMFRIWLEDGVIVTNTYMRD